MQSSPFAVTVTESHINRSIQYDDLILIKVLAITLKHRHYFLAVEVIALTFISLINID